MEKWLVSKCLLGERCRYDGRTLDSTAIQRFLQSRNADIVPVCPECDCGLPCPRPPPTPPPPGVEEAGGELSWVGVIFAAAQHGSLSPSRC